VHRSRIAALVVAGALAGGALAQEPAAPPAAAASFGSLPLQRSDPAAALPGWGGALLALALAALAAAGVQYARRRHGASPKLPAWWAGKPAPGTLQIVQVVRLPQGASLQVVHWGEQELLLACTPAAVNVIGTRPRGPLPGAAEANP
jgi:hypothetical protein